MRESKGLTKPGGEMKVSTNMAGRSPAWLVSAAAARTGPTRKQVGRFRYARWAGWAGPPHGGARIHSGAQAEDLSLSGPTASSRGIPLAST